MAPSAKMKFLDLVAKVESGKTGRSENDLSSNLAAYFESLKLHPVVDTAGGFGGRKRPDIRAYVSLTNADLVLPAEVVVESKKPTEVKGYPNLRAAMIADDIWHDKTLPYVKENIERIRYFALTTFVSFAVFEIDEQLRKLFSPAAIGGKNAALRKAVSEATVEYDLSPKTPPHEPGSAEAWDG